MQDLNLRQLEAFCAVVEEGGFTAAAERLFLAQSTVSGHVAALEKELGVPLLLRQGRRRITLTEEGRQVYAHAEAILQSCGDLSRLLAERESTELCIAASSVPMGYLLPRLLADFSVQAPDCRFTVLSGDSEEVHQLVLEGKVQLGFAGSAPDRREVRCDVLAQDPLVLIAPGTERFRALRRQGTAGNDLLLSEPLILRESGSGTQRAAETFFSENDIPAESLGVVARIGDNGAILRAVAAGLGCAVISGLAAAAAPGTVSFPLLGPGAQRRLYMLRLRDRRPGRAAQSFIDFVLAGVR